MIKKPKISFILPCRDEEHALPFCIEKIQKIIQDYRLDAEIIVSDYSKDNSPTIAQKLGAKVALHNKDGYGNAYLEGFKVAQGEIFVLGDADDTYDFRETPLLLNEIQNHDLVLGQRKFFKKNSMSFLNRYIGNPILSWVLRVLFKANVKDCHSGFRIIKREVLEKLNLQTTGMEFASEMIIKAIKNNISIKEVPIHYYPRKGETKLQRLPDGWRHLRFMLLYSPLYLFLIPGLILFTLGLLSGLLIYVDSFKILGIKLYYHPLFLSSLTMVSGYQLMIFAIFAKTYAITHLREKNAIMEKLYSFITIEKAGIFGLIILSFGIYMYTKIFFGWVNSGFGEMNQIKNSILALTLIILSIQTISSAFMLSMLGIKEK
jgi:glycosyltransferase involved in cell wall biosynthesis